MKQQKKALLFTGTLFLTAFFITSVVGFAQAPRQGQTASGQAKKAPANPPAKAPAQTAEKTQNAIPKIQTVSGTSNRRTYQSLPDTLAEVNGQKISKKEILEEAFRQHREKVLDSQIRLLLISMECQKHKIQVSDEEIEAEIQRMATAVNLTSQDWMDLILKENGMTPDTYRSDIIRPIISLRKLAGARIQVTKEELQKAFEAAYGPSVSLRQIVHNSKKEMERIRKDVVANPNTFATEAKNSSTDPASAAYAGMIRPIRKYTTNDLIEKTVFNLKPGEISPIVEWPQGNYILFQCVEHYPPVQVDRLEAEKFLELKVRDEKMQRVAGEVYTELHNHAQIQMVLTDPDLSRNEKYKNVAAIVNGQTISRMQVAEQCLKLFGEIVLAERISITMLDQECKKRNVQIIEADLDEEIRIRAAREMPLLPDGGPNVEQWLHVQTKSTRTTPAIFRNNTIRPLVMLKKLAKSNVQVSEDDIKKGFEANHGPRARCLAIFFNNMRQAQQVWDQARQIPLQEHFGDLAAKYSVHGPSKALRGEIKPIQKYGGMPVLEEKAFALEPGEISEVIQLGNEEYVILFGLGLTQPIVTNINDVRDLIAEDVHEKKLHLEMQKQLETLFTRSTVTNYLTGETRMAQQPAPANQNPKR